MVNCTKPDCDETFHGAKARCPGCNAPTPHYRKDEATGNFVVFYKLQPDPDQEGAEGFSMADAEDTPAPKPTPPTPPPQLQAVTEEERNRVSRQLALEKERHDILLARKDFIKMEARLAEIRLLNEALEDETEEAAASAAAAASARNPRLHLDAARPYSSSADREGASRSGTLVPRIPTAPPRRCIKTTMAE